MHSLTRFFRQDHCHYPCWVAGRLHPSSSFFELKSQGLTLVCSSFQKDSLKIDAQAGDWVAVHVHEFKNEKAFIKDYKVLSSCKKKFQANKEQVFISQKWQDFLIGVAGFFKSRGLIPVETPSLVRCPGTEPHLQVFETEISPQKQKMFLPTSPEMHLKKMLCEDWTDFFEIKKCFRNGELSSLHQPEFYMLEWYRAFFSSKDLIQETKEFFCFLNNQFSLKAEPLVFKEYRIQDLFLKDLNFSLTPETTKKELFLLAQKKDLICSQEASWEDLFHLLFLNKIEKQFQPHVVTFVKDYPPQLRAYARINKRAWADRFEVYWKGFELANAFYEVIDPKEQKKLFEEHLKQRTDSVSYDQDLLEKMQQGMPPCSGIAIGLERLFLALYNKNKISDIKIFPYQK